MCQWPRLVKPSIKCEGTQGIQETRTERDKNTFRRHSHIQFASTSHLHLHRLHRLIIITISIPNLPTCNLDSFKVGETIKLFVNHLFEIHNTMFMLVDLIMCE
jgi:hypothetical protein